MNYATIGIITMAISAIYWIFIKDGQFKQGLGKFNNKKYADAISDFNKAISKNSNHYKAYFYLGMCYKHLAEQNNINSFKLTAVENFIKSSNCIPYNAKANNLCEFLICSEKDTKLSKDLIDIAMKQLEMSQPSLKEKYHWLYIIDAN